MIKTKLFRQAERVFGIEACENKKAEQNERTRKNEKSERIVHFKT